MTEPTTSDSFMNILPADRLGGIREYYFSSKLRQIEEMNRQGATVINLGIGSPDLPPHPSVIQELYTGAKKPNTHAYQSYKGNPSFREAIAGWYQKWYGVSLDPASEVLPLIGSKEGIMHLCMAFLNPGDRVWVPDPGYPTYRAAATLAGGRMEPYSLTEARHWFPDFEALADKDPDSVKMMFVNYPHMPTGQLPTRKMFEQLIAFARRYHILIVHDNPYSFILNDNPMSILATEGAKEVAVELNSLSKSHNMAGWRIGFLSGDKKFIGDVLRFKSQMDSGMFLPLQLAAVKALELGPEWFQQLNGTYSSRRKVVYELLDRLGCIYSTEGAGMFVWAKIPEEYKDGFEMSDAILVQKRVFLTPGGIFGEAGKKYIRISLCAPEEKFREAMIRIFE